MSKLVAESEALELRREAGGLRHYLDDEPLHAGELLELWLDDGSWALGRYEWTYREADPPLFFVDTETDSVITLRPGARLRWPGRTG